MANVPGCNLPDELLYDVENHIWYREMPDGNVKLGMTTVATAMAGQLVAFTPRKAGRAVEAGKPCATVESGKWVGPAKTAGGGGRAQPPLRREGTTLQRREHRGRRHGAWSPERERRRA